MAYTVNPKRLQCKLMMQFTALVMIAAGAGIPGALAGGTPTILSDNAILGQVLHRQYKDGGYTVVNPEPDLHMFFRPDPEELARTRKHVSRKLKGTVENAEALFNRLVAKNAAPVKLTLSSAPEHGYFVDTEGKFTTYFEKDGGGWDRWYAENPSAHGSTTVSLPYYDPEQKLVLVFLGIQSHYLAGVGHLVVYRVDNGVLTEITRVMLWIS